MFARQLKSVSASTGRGTRRFWAMGGSAVALFALVLSGCGGSSTSGAQGTPQANAVATSTVNCSTADQSSLHLVTPNELTIASDTTYAPAEYVDPNNPNNFLGYDMDLVRELARRLCLGPKIQTASFDSIIDSLSGPPLGQQKYDLSISSFTINSTRLQKVDFIPYFVAGESTLVAKGNPSNIKSVADMCGKTVSAQNGTIELAELQALNGGNVDPSTEGVAQQPVCKTNVIHILSYDSEEDVIQQVVNGRAVASYQDQPVTDYYISLHQAQLEHGFITPNSQGTEGIAVRKDNPGLESALKKALDDMVQDGTYKRIMKAWGQDQLACLPNCPASS
ncbi:MAG TPA: ABC transporter substrate-binding protein [Ktedonobacterales bacterium]